MNGKDLFARRIPHKYQPPPLVRLLINVVILLLIFGAAWWASHPQENAGKPATTQADGARTDGRGRPGADR